MTAVAKKVVDVNEALIISPPDFRVANFKIVGLSPLVQHKFSKKIRAGILDAQTKKAGTKGKKRDPRKPDEEYRDAIHLDENGDYGIPASAFRSAMIDACRMAGYQMTKAKMSVFVVHDGIDADEGSPLVRLYGEPERLETAVRLESGVSSVAIRPMWRQWSCNLKVRWDGDQFSLSDVANLLNRAGLQVGVGEGRPFSKKSHGQGWGTFQIDPEQEVELP